MRIFVSFALFWLLSTTAIAQSRLNNDVKGIVYDREGVIEFRLHTHGWAINYQIGKLKTYYRTNFYEFGLGELKHYKETSKSTDSPTGPTSTFRSYSFGKQNYAFVLRGGLGFKRYYTEKAAKNGVAVGITYAGGVTLALMKPYYLEIGGTRDFNSIPIKYSEATKKDFLDPFKIRGTGGLFDGVGETSIIPGAYGRIGVQVDWGAFDEFLRALEVGIQLDVFPKKLPILVPVNGFDENRPYFLNFYLSLQLGKRR